jgi:hypothetical protein
MRPAPYSNPLSRRDARAPWNFLSEVVAIVLVTVLVFFLLGI